MHRCHECYELADLQTVDEAGGAELCAICAEEFYMLFFRAEAAAEGMER